MHLAIRVDGGTQIGYGHLMRTNALVEAILARGHEVTVASTTPDEVQAIFPDGTETVGLASRGDPNPFVDWVDANSPDVVFTDSYPVNTEYQRAIRDRVPLAVFQDDARHAICADIFINGNLYGPDLDYEFLGDKPQTHLGTDYVLLRSDIRNQADAEPPWRDPPERAIVTMGGGDATNQTPTVINAFDGVDIRVDAIVGPGFSETQERAVRAAADAVSADVDVVRDPEDLPARMFAADLAVATASSTTYELLALSTPLVSVPVVDNQEPIATALRDRDAAIVLDRGAGEAAFSRSIDRYLGNAALRRQRRERGRELVDDQGVDRVADAVCEVAGE